VLVLLDERIRKRTQRMRGPGVITPEFTLGHIQGNGPV
jgi:hypothetical protein